ncbi:hypothetical protein ACJ3XI_02225 [Litorimonas sp. RW-G-Af-16]|uniref:hypothetical protein n=1 Tax=Litorimonas sp. RW-G-Af-16 TaxID=3241168 RepID=UPI00390CA09F
MTPVQIAPFVAAGLFILVTLIMVFKPSAFPKKGLWRLPALFAFAFLAWSVFAVLQEGPLGFWTEHTRNLWGNQIWFDLLIAIGIGWALIIKRARAVEMKLPLWLLITILTGCIGFSAMLSRLLYLEEKEAGA